MKTCINLSKVPRTKRSRLQKQIERRIKRLGHQLSQILSEKSSLRIAVQHTSQGANQWAASLELNFQLGVVRVRIVQVETAEKVLDQAFSVLAKKTGRKYERSRKLRSRDRTRTQRLERKQRLEEIDAALVEQKEQDMIQFLTSHIDVLRKEAWDFLEQKELLGELSGCWMHPEEIVQEALSEACSCYRFCSTSLPWSTWFSTFLGNVIEREKRSHAHLISFSEKQAQ